MEQIDGLPEKYTAKPESDAVPVNLLDRDAALDTCFNNIGPTICEGGDRACYNVAHDLIKMPPLQAFKNSENYYATLAHEMTHATKHPLRLNREFGREKWGDEGYAKEELVAELGSAFLCAELGITPETREDHAAYIASWLKVLKQDKPKKSG